MKDSERVHAASDRLVDVLSRLQKEGFGPNVLHLALVDASVRLAKLYAPIKLTVDILREISSLVRGMVKDEEDEIRTKALQRSKEH